MADEAQAVYAAEDLWEGKERRAQIRFGDWHEIWPFYHKLSKTLAGYDIQVKPPTVKERKGALKAHYDSGSRTVFIPSYEKGGSWALRVSTALHEFAHHLAPGAGHGPQFRKAMLQCAEAVGMDPEILEQCYAKVGLTATSKGDKAVDLVVKMLNQADGAGTPEERTAFLEGAQRVASKHSLDMALLRKRQADKGDPVTRPTTSDLYDLTALTNVTMRNLTVNLADSITTAHNVKLLIRGKSRYLTFLGFEEDIALSKLMIERITPMMFEEADAYVKSPERRASGVAPVSARINFCQAFAGRVGGRLREAVKTTEEEQSAADSTGTTALVLRDKQLQVQDHIAYEFKRLGVRGHWTGSQSSCYDGGAVQAGRDAADRADLYGRKALT